VILTAVRSGEARGAHWDEIDPGARMWIIPVQRMKGGKEHRVPLSDRAWAILKEMQELRQNDLVFPGSKQGRPLSDMSLLMLLRELRSGITTHGFRSTFKDWAAERTKGRIRPTSCLRRRWPTLSPTRWRQPTGAPISSRDAGN
jgi:integrase